MGRYLVNLTFDLEEFDIPEEYGQKVSERDQMEVTLAGMKRILPVLDKHNVAVTFFTTGHFAQKNPELIRLLSDKHEIASHALYHAPNHDFQEQDILVSKQILEFITGKFVNGFRMPRLRPFDEANLAKWGFRYDSSVNPTYLPGRYNLLHKSPLPYHESGMWELPCSTMPWLRFPLFWLSFKNLPAGIYSEMCRLTLRKRKSLMLYFHPWEFADIGDYKLPGYVKSPDGQALTDKLDKLISYLIKHKGEFITCQQLCDTLDADKEKI
ncbi:polysaccharide deacetylase family protein [Dyadobacter sp. CY312]|uniref:polysaccharide deacetylase family protein n=1 Tax=Dyadobacter sp. CY312 TaxID=2907303 RepID=UPI001F1F9F1A|nr:polysaccharide deacetylase family protein [Dyadobacter sp. CY312]MCE7041452.1 polysaccharide deacetylase family protein [Dyadobacter sp. CY312]